MLLPPHPTRFTHTCAHGVFPTSPLRSELLKRDGGEPGHVCLWAMKREAAAQTSCRATCATMRLNHNLQTHPGHLAAYSDSSKTPKSQWLILIWRLFRHQLCSSMDHCSAPYLFPWHPGFPGKMGAPQCSCWHFSLAHVPTGQQRLRLYFFSGTMDVVREAKRLKEGEVRILIC